MKSIITVIILFLHKRILLKPPFQENSRQKENPSQELTSILMGHMTALRQMKTEFSFTITVTGNQVLSC
jgi:hypothetical protein